MSTKLPSGLWQGWVLGYVNLGYSKLDDGIAALASNPSQPPLTVRGGEVGLWTIDQQTGRLTTTYSLDLGGSSIENVKAILSANGTWSIDESGKLVVKEIETEKLKAQSATFGSQAKLEGITLFDPSGNPYCVRIETGGAVVSTSGECGTGSSTPSSSESATSTKPGVATERVPAPASTATTTP